MNPILPLKYYVPDVEAKVFSDGKLYLYGSYDLPGNDEYCSKDYYVFSSADFVNFEKSELAFTNREPGLTWAKGDLYAPDCAEKDGMYYLYFCAADGSEGVAKSRSPMGPFMETEPVKGAHPSQIDPTVFIDDDGQAYYYWGQFQLKGAKLNEDMCTLDMETYNPRLLIEEKDGFHEGASICKRNNLYYMVFADSSRGRPTCLGYAVAKSPLGPFKKKGIIIDNTGCDPSSWNNHGSICEVDGQWYVFYHRSTHNSFFSRRVCVEPIFFEHDGSIREVEMTVCGQEKEIKCTCRLEASRASCLNGKVFIEAGTAKGDYEEHLTNIKNGDWAEYKYLTFDHEKKFTVEAGSFTYGGTIEVHIESPEGPQIGEVRVDNTGGWNNYRTFSCEVSEVKGRQAVYLRFTGDNNRLFDVAGFWFE